MFFLCRYNNSLVIEFSNQMNVYTNPVGIFITWSN